MTQPSRWLRLAAVSASLAAGACGSDTTADSQRIGAAGGTIETAGATLDVPPGALDQEVDISISTTAEAGPDGYTASSPIFVFEPDGLEFSRPAEVRISFEGDGAPSIVWSLREGDGFEMLTTDRSGATATAQVVHFSRGFVGESDDVAVDAGPDGPDAAMDGGESCGPSEVLCDGIDNDCNSSTSDTACPAGEFCLQGQCASAPGG